MGIAFDLHGSQSSLDGIYLLGFVNFTGRSQSIIAGDIRVGCPVEKCPWTPSDLRNTSFIDTNERLELAEIYWRLPLVDNGGSGLLGTLWNIR